MASSRQFEETASETHAQIAELRRQVEHLMHDRLTPALAEAAGRAEHMARNATAYTRERSDMVAERVRGRPLSAVLIAAATGYLLGRFLR
jgi:ElaB/YqjD/DUF883 family membrane-anchored ribosome-binding protein